MWEIPERVTEFVRKRIRSKAYREYIYRVGEELFPIDTTPKADVAQAREAEHRVFRMLRREGERALGSAEFSFRPIDPSIASHPYYTPPYYAPGLSPEEVYDGRGNLLAFLKGAGGGPTLALNGHIDTVAPDLPFRRDGDTFYGRGTSDDMGNVLAMLVSMKALGELEGELGVRPRGDLWYMFVIEEETGGNGSLSLALDPEVSYDAIVVHEAVDFKVHPANRGAVWYKVDILRDGESRVNPVELASYVVLALEEEGRRIREESEHPLFPSRPVQTCQGILGPFGKHPSAVNDEVVLRFRVPEGRRDALRKVVEEGLEEYIRDYGDKTKEVDPETGSPKVPRHYLLEDIPGGVRLTVLGKAGHMGAIRELDDAITKAAYIVRRAMEVEAEVGLDVEGYDEELVLEGGQGFLPTHSLDEVTCRMTQAVRRGVTEYLRDKGIKAHPERFFRVSYDKLHNDAYDGDPDGPLVRAGVYALKLAGLWRDEPITGWEVSCDARLFAKLRPGHETVCMGCGTLSRAHSQDEYITGEEVALAAEVLTYTILSYCGVAVG